MSKMLVVALVVAGGCSSGMQQWLRDEGYRPVLPPTMEIGPGMIVWMNAQGPTTLCSPVDAVGTSPAIRRRARTIGIGWMRLDEAYLKRIRRHSGFYAVLKVQVKLSEVEELSIERGPFARSPGCNEAIARARADGKTPAMARVVLRAQALFSVTFSERYGLDQEAQLAQVRALAAALHADPETATASSMSGAGTWGLIEDEALVSTDPS